MDGQLYGRNLIWKKRKPSQTLNNGICLSFTWYLVTVIIGLFLMCSFNLGIFVSIRLTSLVSISKIKLYKTLKLSYETEFPTAISQDKRILRHLAVGQGKRSLPGCGGERILPGHSQRPRGFNLDVGEDQGILSVCRL